MCQMLVQLKLFMALSFLQDHFKQCQFSTEECEFCGQAIHLLEMSTHMATCPKAGKLCSLADLGCTAVRVSQLLNPVYQYSIAITCFNRLVYLIDDGHTVRAALLRAAH